jgi:hypothetical protein
MYKMRKNLAIVFLLFIIFVSLLFSNIFNQYRLEGMTTTSIGDIEKPSEGTDTDTDSSGPVVESESGPVVESESDSSGPVVETDSDSSGPVVETDSDSSGPVVKTTDDTNPDDDTSPHKESFQTRLVGTPINYKSAPQTTTLDHSLRAKPEINGVFNHIFGFSNNQIFHVKQP